MPQFATLHVFPTHDAAREAFNKVTGARKMPSILRAIRWNGKVEIFAKVADMQDTQKLLGQHYTALEIHHRDGLPAQVEAVLRTMMRHQPV